MKQLKKIGKIVSFSLVLVVFGLGFIISARSTSSSNAYVQLSQAQERQILGGCLVGSCSAAKPTCPGARGCGADSLCAPGPPAGETACVAFGTKLVVNEAPATGTCKWQLAWGGCIDNIYCAAEYNCSCVPSMYAMCSPLATWKEAGPYGCL